jgi:predicted HAD superfamily Cof-like phosphohydrolase
MMTWGNLIIEELQELAIAFDKQDPVEFLDAIADIIYVTAQQADLYGWPLDAALREVHRSNMSKLDADGNPIIREDGKVLKGPDFSEPELSQFINNVQIIADAEDEENV